MTQMTRDRDGEHPRGLPGPAIVLTILGGVALAVAALGWAALSLFT